MFFLFCIAKERVAIKIKKKTIYFYKTTNIPIAERMKNMSYVCQNNASFLFNRCFNG